VSTPQPKLHEYVKSFGSGVHFIEVERLHQDFADTGMTFTAFMKWLKSLHVPVIWWGKKRYVRLQSFRLALIAISRIGEKDFVAPGSAYKFGLGAYPDTITGELDAKRFQEDMEGLIAELLYSQKGAGLKLRKRHLDAAKEAAKMIVGIGLECSAKEPQRAYVAQVKRAMKQANYPMPKDLLDG